MKKYLALLLAVIAIQGCSSGGGDSAPPPTAPDTVFQLFPSNAFTTGSTDTINYTGTDTKGGVWNGTISSQVQSQSTFLGQPAIPVLTQLQLTNTANGAIISNIGTVYYTTTASDRRYLGYSDASSTTVSANTSTIPQTAKIGSFGVIGTYTDNAGAVDAQSWRLDDAGGGRAKVVQLSTEKDQFGNLDISSTTTSVIETSGNRISQTLVIFFANENVTLTLNGS
ncbi:MAG: hypothetical protein COA54_15050 [Thiotrichaceae bacterium]|nr:MAG: hypothetical protein COA54_15050 [Thiotrichaceae bacterium]